MTETSTIYYHKPKIRKTNLRKEILGSTSEITGEILPVVNAKTANDSAKNIITECEVPTESIFNYSSNTLRSLGLTGKYDGFMYMCSAIEQILTEKEPPHFQSIYYDIGKIYDVNRCSVERSIRYAIGFVKRAGNRHNLAAIFGDAMDDEKNFSNSKFLTILAADVYDKLTSVISEK
jgi:hypothetical protein